MHFGAKDNLIMPGRSANMGDGWETRRRRGPGHDWLILRLGGPGLVEKVEIDTNHFKGNYPDTASLEGCRTTETRLEALASEAAGWQEVLPRTKLRPAPSPLPGPRPGRPRALHPPALPHLPRRRGEPASGPWTRCSG